MFRFFISTLFFCALFASIAADEWSGTDYAQNSSVQQSHAERLLNSLSLNGDEVILDLGCGDGKVTAQLAKKVPFGKVVGIDPSDSMLQKAGAAIEESCLMNLTFVKGAAENFSCNDRFDHIIAIHVMHWVKEQEEALKNIYGHLKPEGHVHFILAPSKEGLPFYTALEKTLQTWSEYFTDFVNPQAVFDMETYRKLMVNAGFHIEAIHYLYHESIHENKERLKSWIKQWQPHVKHIPLEKQERFLDELIDNYLVEIGVSRETSAPVKWGEYVLIVEGSRGKPKLS